MIFYFVCLFSLVFFPLPSTEQITSLKSHSIQLIPFRFIADILRETPFVISNPHTYLPSLFHRAVLQVLFNVLMMLPFGMLLRYYFGFNQGKIILFTFLLSLFIEIGQLTGLFFIYPGSYRLCDVDDLIANTMGGYLGYRLFHCFESYIPNLKVFDIALPTSLRSHRIHF
jgi:glycopeptide antibiotics resistance protein